MKPTQLSAATFLKGVVSGHCPTPGLQVHDMHAAHTFAHQAAPPACIHTLATNNHSILACSCTPLTTATTTTRHKTERPHSSRLELAWRNELHLVVHNTRGALGAVSAAALLLGCCTPACPLPLARHLQPHTPTPTPPPVGDTCCGR
jgi:hypothetical protein